MSNKQSVTRVVLKAEDDNYIYTLSNSEIHIGDGVFILKHPYFQNDVGHGVKEYNLTEDKLFDLTNFRFVCDIIPNSVDKLAILNDGDVVEIERCFKVWRVKKKKIEEELPDTNLENFESWDDLTWKDVDKLALKQAHTLTEEDSEWIAKQGEVPSDIIAKNTEDEIQNEKLYKYFIELINGFKKLSHGWDSYEAEVIDEKAMLMARNTVSSLRDQGGLISSWSTNIFPDRNGGIQFKFDGDNLCAELVITKKGDLTLTFFNKKGDIEYEIKDILYYNVMGSINEYFDVKCVKLENSIEAFEGIKYFQKY